MAKMNEEVKAAKAVEAVEAEAVEAVEAEAKAEVKTDARIEAGIEALQKKLAVYPRSLTVSDLIAYRMYGIEEWLTAQRTPSHTTSKAIEIIESALAGIPCGVITLGRNTETGGISTINGSSRIDDFIRYYSGTIGRKERMYADLATDAQKAFLAHKLTVDWLEGTEKELIRDFKNLNNDTALTGGQKATTNLAGSDAMAIVARLAKHSIFTTMFSARQIQKQEPNNCIFLILANLTDSYNAKADKLTEALAAKDLSIVDVDKLIYIFDKIESADVELNKYKFVHIAHLMYIGDCWKSKNQHIEFDVDDLDDAAIGNAVAVNYATSGTNSADANAERIAKMAKKLYLHFTTTGKPEKPAANVSTLDPATL